MTLLTVKDYAEHSGLPVSSVRRMCKANALPSVKIGVAWRINAEEADNIILQRIETRQKPKVIVPARKQQQSFLERLKAL